MSPIGTVLFNRKHKKAGMVLGFSYEKNYYDVDSDDEWFWSPNDVEQVPEKDALVYILKHG